MHQQVFSLSVLNRHKKKREVFASRYCIPIVGSICRPSLSNYQIHKLANVQQVDCRILVDVANWIELSTYDCLNKRADICHRDLRRC